MKKVVRFYEGSYQFDSVETTLNVHPDFIQMKLAKQYEYRATTETLWATVNEGEKEVARYQFDYNKGLTEITKN